MASSLWVVAVEAIWSLTIKNAKRAPRSHLKNFQNRLWSNSNLVCWMYSELMNFLIIGGAGYLGSHITEELINYNHSLTIFDNISGNIKTKFQQPIRMVTGDITQFEDLARLDDFGPFDCVFHLAAKKSVRESHVNPDLYYLVN